MKPDTRAKINRFIAIASLEITFGAVG